MAAGAINPFAWVSDSGAVTFQSDANTALEKQVVEALREAMRRLKKAPMRVFREHWLTDLRYRQTGIPTAGKSVARGSVVKVSAHSPVLILILCVACVHSHWASRHCLRA